MAFAAGLYLRWAGAASLASLAGCEPVPVADPFDDTGKLIALSGADAGPEAACHTCHGLDGGGDGALVPRIAAMDAGYLVRQLGFYADGQRSHPQMSWLAGRLDSDERMAVAIYYAAMPMPARTDPIASSEEACIPEAAFRIYHRGAPERALAACASCHGANGAGLGPGNPSLIGQSAAYHAEQLRRWRGGRRYGDALDVMHDAASKLRDEEINPLADYISGNPGPSDRPGSRAICR